MVCVMLVSAYASAQNITITGNVSDNTGPVVGVTVVVRGTVSTATTDLDGNYSITAPSTATLTFSSIGYKTVEVPVNGRTRIDVTLEEEAYILEDLVVVGFGTQKKVNLTGAVSSRKRSGSADITSHCRRGSCTPGIYSGSYHPGRWR